MEALTPSQFAEWVWWESTFFSDDDRWEEDALDWIEDQDQE